LIPPGQVTAARTYSAWFLPDERSLPPDTAVDYRFLDASYLTDTERIDMVVKTAEFTYWDRLGGLDILPAEYDDGYMWAEENVVHTLSYYLTGRVPDYRDYNNTAAAVKKFSNRYRFWPANGMGKKNSISILHISNNQDYYIIDYTHDYWDWFGGDDLSIDYSQRHYGTIEVKRSGNIRNRKWKSCKNHDG